VNEVRFYGQWELIFSKTKFLYEIKSMNYDEPIKRIYSFLKEIRLRKLVLVVIIGVGLSPGSQGQDLGRDTGPKENVQNILEDFHAPSSRGDGVSGALVTSADDLDATWHNPAGIGGLQVQKERGPWIRKLYFPWIAFSANKNSWSLAKDFKSAGGNYDRIIGKSVMAAHAGQRQYARAHVLSGVLVGRLLLVPINDLQIAATTQADDKTTGDIDESEYVTGHFKSLSGVGGGISAQSSDGALSLGYFGYSVHRVDIEGDFKYDDMINAPQRRKVLNETEKKSAGNGHHVGLIWKIGKIWAPTLGIAIKNLGDTTFHSKSEGFISPKVSQNTSMGFTIGPNFNPYSSLKMTIQADRLDDPEVALGKKYRLGFEFLLGGLSSHSTFALRAGGTQAGGSIGLGVNLGLIGCNAAIHSVDIGVGNQKVIERRGVVDAFVNVAEF
jgi:hypothetical protein